MPRTILLVEDDPVVRHVVRLLLELEGDLVVEAKDGEEALSILGSHEGPLDLLLTDVMMPGLSGAEVCDRVRAGRPGLPTLFISGFYPEAVFPDQRLPEDSAFLAKPFMPEELVDAGAGRVFGGEAGAVVDVQEHAGFHMAVPHRDMQGLENVAGAREAEAGDENGALRPCEQLSHDDGMRLLDEAHEETRKACNSLSELAQAAEELGRKHDE